MKKIPLPVNGFIRKRGRRGGKVKVKPQKTIIFLSTWGLIGFSPVAPGTFGSLTALPLCLLISVMRIDYALIFIVLFFFLATWIAHRAEKLEGQEDPKQVVIDEVFGMGVALFALPFTPYSGLLS